MDLRWLYAFARSQKGARWSTIRRNSLLYSGPYADWCRPNTDGPWKMLQDGVRFVFRMSLGFSPIPAIGYNRDHHRDSGTVAVYTTEYSMSKIHHDLWHKRARQMIMIHWRDPRWHYYLTIDCSCFNTWQISGDRLLQNMILPLPSLFKEKGGEDIGQRSWLIRRPLYGQYEMFLHLDFCSDGASDVLWASRQVWSNTRIEIRISCAWQNTDQIQNTAHFISDRQVISW